MTKQELSENHINSLKGCLNKAFSFWLNKTKIDKSRIESKISINCNKLNTEIFLYYLINPEKDENKNN